MNWLNRLRLAGVLIAGGGLALAYGLNGLWQWSWIFVALSPLWWWGQARGWQPVASIGMAAVFLGAVLGIWLGVHPLAMLLVTGAALVAWDLDGFEQRRCQREPDPALQDLANRHLIRLGVVLFAGIGVSGVVMSRRTGLNFWVVLVIGLILAISLSRAFLLIGRQARGDSPEDRTPPE